MVGRVTEAEASAKQLEGYQQSLLVRSTVSSSIVVLLHTISP